MLAWSRDWSRGIAYDHVTDHVIFRHNFILETICGAGNIRNSHFLTLRKPIGQTLDCAIAGFNYPVHSHFREPLSTVNWPTSPGRNSPPLSSHHNSRAQSLHPCSENILKQFQNLSQPNFLITSANTFKDVFACKNVLAANHQYSGNIQRCFRSKQYTSSNQQSSSKQYPSRNQQSSSNQQQQQAITQQAVSQPQPAIVQQPATATSLHAATSIHPRCICTTDANLC